MHNDNALSELIKGLFGFGKRKVAPIFVAGARTGAAAFLTAFSGVVLTQLNALDWGQYAWTAPVVMGGVRFLLEGLGDQLKERNA